MKFRFLTLPACLVLFIGACNTSGDDAPDDATDGDSGTLTETDSGGDLRPNDDVDSTDLDVVESDSTPLDGGPDDLSGGDVSGDVSGEVSGDADTAPSDAADITAADVNDTNAPTVEIFTPSDGEVLSGSVVIEVVATDDVGVVSVDLFVGGSVVTTMTTEPFTFEWDTTSVPNGAAEILATARDSAGNEQSTGVTVTVANDTCGTTVFFDPSQVASIVSEGVNEDTIRSNGYLFTYTRDKLFTGGVGMTEPIGRSVVIDWPEGVQAQAVTVGPNMGGGRIVIRREDGVNFDLVSFTGRLFGNTAATGAQFEIMPSLDGEDALDEPVFFDASGYYGSDFSYDQTPNILGSTAALNGYQAYSIGIFVDFALVALTLECNP